jgi:hypothetical protein
MWDKVAMFALQRAPAHARRTGGPPASTGCGRRGDDMTLLRTILDRLGFGDIGGPPMAFA